MDFLSLLKNELNIELTETQIEQFNKYYQLLEEWNQKIDLTAIMGRDEVFLKHFYDSLTLSQAIELSDQSICDVGAGAGFPSIPLKIAFPNLKVTIVDSLNKRINFLNIVIEELGLTNTSAVHARAEEYTEKHREGFDIVTARAVARFNILIELCSGLVKKNGYFIAMKASKANEELQEAKSALNTLGFNVEKNVEMKLPIEESSRYIIKCKKVANTPKMYPRSFAQIKKKSL